MRPLNVLAHCSFIGTNGLNAHFRQFHRELAKHCNLKLRNFTVGDSWKGLSRTPHDREPYLTEADKKLLHIQTLWETDGTRKDHHIYEPYNGTFDVNIVSDLVDHYYFYDTYTGPKIAYVVWESTKMFPHFIERLKFFDEIWVPSHWQKQCMVEQGLDPDIIYVVPCGVEADVFFPEEVKFDKYFSDGRFKFLVFGRWDHRKATKEIIEAFLQAFPTDEPVDLVLSVDNGFPGDGMKTTEERMNKYGFSDPRLKVVHFVSREDYVKFIKRGHVLLSCSRGEGVNLPLLEAMATGTPVIYSQCSGQLEFTKGRGNPVRIAGVSPSNTGDGGMYSEPDFKHLVQVMRQVYDDYAACKARALEDSVSIRENYNWPEIGVRGSKRLYQFYQRVSTPLNATKKKLKVMYVTPHLSTGGMPQFLLKRIESIHEECEVYCVEYEQIATFYVVQRNKIQALLGERFISLHDQPKEKLLELIDAINPDVIHFEEFPETFVSKPVATRIYRKSRNYLIFESYHGIWFHPREKMYFPDKFLFVSEFQSELYKEWKVPFEVVEYPVETRTPNKARCLAELGLDPTYKHVINVGLFTPGKNQKELVEYARALLNEKIQFHFIGNQAGNFENYWQPLMKDLPANCRIWGEREDVDKFYQAADLMVFTSIMETSPLVIREAISWQLPSLIHNLPSYKNMYSKYPSVKYLANGEFSVNINLIKSALHLL